MSIFVLLVLIALILTVVSATGKAPLWAAVFVLCIMELLRIYGS